MPKVKKETVGKKPANEQKGEKICNFCHQTKKMTSFYISKSPLYSVDERVPVCKECMINTSLNEDGTINELELNKILKKVGEECTEVIIAGKADDKAETIYEIADLAYHIMVMMVEMGISVDDVMKELASRHIIDHKVKQEKMTK